MILLIYVSNKRSKIHSVAMSRLRMVLVPRGRSAAQVALVLVALQNGAHLLVQHAVKPAQAQGDVFVYRYYLLR